MSAAQPNPQPPSLEQMKAAAGAYLSAAGAAAASERIRADIDACAEHLVRMFGVADEVAADAVLKAWAELEGKHSRVYFDLAQSTPYLVVIIDPIGGQRRAVSSTDLLRIIGPRPVAAAAQDADA